MSQTQSALPATTGRRNRQRPKIVFRLLNPLMKLILRSPLHGAMSKRMMVLSFVGRKTGKRYSTPVAYSKEGGHVIVVTFSPWWVNFKQAAPAQMQIQGKTVTGTAMFVNDPERIRRIVHNLTLANGKQMMQRMGLWIEDLESLSPDAVQQATQGAYIVEITTQG